MTQISKQLGATPTSPKQAARRRTPIDKAMDLDFFKALSDPTRTKLLSCLAQCGRPCSVSEIAECCSVDFSVVARHLATLERAELVESRKEGRTVWYSAQCEAISRRLRALADAMECCGEACANAECGCVETSAHDAKTN